MSADMATDLDWWNRRAETLRQAIDASRDPDTVGELRAALSFVELYVAAIVAFRRLKSRAD